MTAGSLVGRTVGNYEVRAKIGEGGMGVVYLAEHPRITKKVAVKVLNASLQGDHDDHLRRFLNEARAASEIRSDHVIDIFDFGELPEGAPYLVMEWLEGEPLSNLIRTSGPVPVERALHILRGITRALAAAHQRGVVHRDLKPDNVFLVERNGDRDFVKVLDFGIAQLADTGENTRRTATGTLIGTPAYMSPEQCRGLRSVDHRSDIYSLGVIAYELTTGKLPFTAEGLGNLLLAHLFQTPPAPAELNPAVPADVSAAIMKALAKEQDQRFASATELLATLERGGKTVPPTEALPLPPAAAYRPTEVLGTSPRPQANTTLSRASTDLPAVSAAPPATAGSDLRARLLIPIGAVAVLAVSALVWYLRASSTPVATPAGDTTRGPIEQNRKQNRPVAGGAVTPPAPDAAPRPDPAVLAPTGGAATTQPTRPKRTTGTEDPTARTPAGALERDFPEPARSKTPGRKEQRKGIDEPGPARPRLELQTDFPSR
jgi:eukaryotic-like serine/threonine-protein kinase